MDAAEFALLHADSHVAGRLSVTSEPLASSLPPQSPRGSPPFMAWYPSFSSIPSKSVKHHLIMANDWVNLVLSLYTEGEFQPYAIDLHGSNISFKLCFHITESLLVSFKKYSYFFPSYECFFLLIFYGC